MGGKNKQRTKGNLRVRAGAGRSGHASRERGAGPPVRVLAGGGFSAGARGEGCARHMLSGARAAVPVRPGHRPWEPAAADTSGWEGSRQRSLRARGRGRVPVLHAPAALRSVQAAASPSRLLPVASAATRTFLF